MKLIVEENYDLLSQKAADLVISVAGSLNGPVNICIPAGRTPMGMYQKLVRHSQCHPTAFQHVNWLTLDEYVKVPNDSAITCFSRLNDVFYQPAGIASEKVFTYNTEADDCEKEASRYEAVINDLGGLHLSILGIGLNGHVGFNEPGSTIDSRTRVLHLHKKTLEQSKNYSKEGLAGPDVGITLGIQTLLESKTVLLFASSAEKQAIVQSVWEGEIGPDVPASFFRTHKNAYFIIDETAAGKLSNRG